MNSSINTSVFGFGVFRQIQKRTLPIPLLRLPWRFVRAINIALKKTKEKFFISEDTFWFNYLHNLKSDWNVKCLWVPTHTTERSTQTIVYNLLRCLSDTYAWMLACMHAQNTFAEHSISPSVHLSEHTDLVIWIECTPLKEVHVGQKAWKHKHTSERVLSRLSRWCKKGLKVATIRLIHQPSSKRAK